MIYVNCPFSNQGNEKTDLRNDFMINRHKVAELGFQFAAHGSAVKCPNDCAIEPGSFFFFDEKHLFLSANFNIIFFLRVN